MNFEPLIELTRNGVQECVHMGALAVTDTEGRVLAQVGNPHWLCFTRSTLKALQAPSTLNTAQPRPTGLKLRRSR